MNTTQLTVLNGMLLNTLRQDAPCCTTKAILQEHYERGGVAAITAYLFPAAQHVLHEVLCARHRGSVLAACVLVQEAMRGIFVKFAVLALVLLACMQRVHAVVEVLANGCRSLNVDISFDDSYVLPLLWHYYLLMPSIICAQQSGFSFPNDTAVAHSCV
jgi:hypothetical protein